MSSRTQPIGFASCRVVVFLFSGAVILSSTSMLAEDGEVEPRARPKLSVNNVRVLDAFEQHRGHYPFFSCVGRHV